LGARVSREGWAFWALRRYASAAEPPGYPTWWPRATWPAPGRRSDFPELQSRCHRIVTRGPAHLSVGGTDYLLLTTTLAQPSVGQRRAGAAMPTTTDTADLTGKAFERRVAELYRAAGADEVQHDIRVVGRQVDVLVTERTPSGTVIRTVVECKSGREKVGVGVVYAFITMMKIIQEEGTFVGAIVSESGSTKEAREAAAQRDIRLLEVADLEQRARDEGALSASAQMALAGAGSIRHELRDALRSSERLTPPELDDLAAHLSSVLESMGEALQLGRARQRRSQRARTLLGILSRMEDEAERCLEAIHHMCRVTEVLDEAERVGVPPSGTEADHAAATFIRLRELDQARSQLRYRAQRLEETSLRAGD
jgi:hypothetical protein